MNVEIKPDMFAIQWSIGDLDFELMLSLEPCKWALPLEIEYHSHSGTFHGYTCVERVFTKRVLCLSAYVSWNRTTHATCDVSK